MFLILGRVLVCVFWVIFFWVLMLVILVFGKVLKIVLISGCLWVLVLSVLFFVFLILKIDGVLFLFIRIMV